MPTPAPAPGNKSSVAAPKMPAGTQVPWRPMRLTPVATETTSQMQAPNGAVTPAAPQEEKSGGSILGAVVGAGLGALLLKSIVGAVAGGALGYVVGPKSSGSGSKVPADCYDGLSGVALAQAQFLLTAPTGTPLPDIPPGIPELTVYTITPEYLRTVATEVEYEDGNATLAACLRARANQLEAK